MFIDNEFVQSNVAIHFITTLLLINFHFHCRLIISVRVISYIVCFVRRCKFM